MFWGAGPEPDPSQSLGLVYMPSPSLNSLSRWQAGWNKGPRPVPSPARPNQGQEQGPWC